MNDFVASAGLKYGTIALIVKQTGGNPAAPANKGPLPQASPWAKASGGSRSFASFAGTVGLFIGIILIWEAIVRLANVREFLLPAPSRIANEFFSNFAALTKDFAWTSAESVAGFLLATLVAFSIASVFAHSAVVRNGVLPLLIGIKAIPIVAVAPLLVIWIGNGFASKAVMAALISFFPIIVNVTKGLTSIDREHIDLFRSYSASTWQVYAKLRCPSAMPFLFAALKTASTLAVVGAIVAEFSGADRGLGYVILLSALRIETPMLFAAIAAAAVLGVAMYYAIEIVEILVLPEHLRRL